MAWDGGDWGHPRDPVLADGLVWVLVGAAGVTPAPVTLLLESLDFDATAPEKGNGWDMLLTFVWACAPHTVILWLFWTQYLI